MQKTGVCRVTITCNSCGIQHPFLELPCGQVRLEFVKQFRHFQPNPPQSNRVRAASKSMTSPHSTASTNIQVVLLPTYEYSCTFQLLPSSFFLVSDAGDQVSLSLAPGMSDTSPPSCRPTLVGRGRLHDPTI